MGLLELDPSLVDLSENVKILVLVHRGLVGLVDIDVVLLPHLFYLSLHHAVMIVQSFIGVFGFTDRQLQLLFDFFLCRISNTLEVMFSFKACYLASSSSSSASSSYYSSPTAFESSSWCFSSCGSSLSMDSMTILERFKLLFLNCKQVTVRLRSNRCSIEGISCQGRG